jgi:hypothetical protein
MAILQKLLPYRDPRRRRMARKAANQLVDCVPSAEIDPMPIEIAQLALLRLLWLQRLAHSPFPKAAEVHALIARASVETLITGLYWLHSEDGEGERARADTARAFRRLMLPFSDEDVLTEVLIDGVAEALGPNVRPLSLLDMAKAVTRASGRRSAEDLYERFYRPLSILVAHPSAMALLRHAKGDRVDERPSRVWSIRAARHTADACMACLAIGLAEEKQIQATQLQPYFEAHISRSTPPMATVLGLAFVRLLHPQRIRHAAGPTMDLWRYYRSGRAAADPYSVRRAKTAVTFRALFDAFGIPFLGDDNQVIDHFVETLARPVVRENSDVASPDETPPTSS